MTKRPRILRSQRKIIGAMTIVNPDAAGIDAGSEQHFVSVPEDRSHEAVRSFGTFTEDLYALADWLVECRIKTVAIEATGVYWIPLFEVLEARGLEVKLVDSRSIGRRNKKTDVLDCQWIRQLHAYGLLDGAFRPAADFLPLRAYRRQRGMLIEYAADHIRHMQKALDLMNLKLHKVIADITGDTGLRIIHAILKGDRDPHQLAALRDPHCKNSVETIAKALMGNYRDEHIFALQQAVDLFEIYQLKITECDQALATELDGFEKQADPSKLAEKPKVKKRRKNQPRFEARTLLHEMTGVDLTAVPGLEASTTLTILSETGTDMSPWPSEGHFASWLALAPKTPVTGGKPIKKRGPRIQPNRAAQAFLLAAQAVAKAQSSLGAFFRRIKARDGWAVAIKATAHKLAVIFYSMMKNKTPYREAGVDYYEKRYRQKLLKSLEKKAISLGYQLAPIAQ